LLSGPKTVALVDAKQVSALPATTRARFTEFILAGSKDGEATNATNAAGVKP
jgi:hypothetical protein